MDLLNDCQDLTSTRKRLLSMNYLIMFCWKLLGDQKNSSKIPITKNKRTLRFYTLFVNEFYDKKKKDIAKIIKKVTLLYCIFLAVLFIQIYNWGAHINDGVIYTFHRKGHPLDKILILSKFFGKLYMQTYIG